MGILNQIIRTYFLSYYVIELMLKESRKTTQERWNIYCINTSTNSRCVRGNFRMQMGELRRIWRSWNRTCLFWKQYCQCAMQARYCSRIVMVRVRWLSLCKSAIIVLLKPSSKRRRMLLCKYVRLLSLIRYVGSPSLKIIASDIWARPIKPVITGHVF